MQHILGNISRIVFKWDDDQLFCLYPGRDGTVMGTQGLGVGKSLLILEIMAFKRQKKVRDMDLAQGPSCSYFYKTNLAR